MSRNPVPLLHHAQPADAAARLHDRHRERVAGLRQPGPRLNLRAPDIYQYNLTLERELRGDVGLRVSYIGSTMRKLLVHRDSTPCRRAPCRSATSTRIRPPRRGCPSRSTARSWTSRQNAGEGRFDALQLELQRRFRHGLAINAAYTLAGSDSNAPDSGNSTIGVVQYDPYDIEKDRGPDPNVVKHRVVDQQHLGPARRTRSAACGAACRAGPTRSSAAGPCRRSSRRAPAEPDAVLHLRHRSGSYPANTGRALDGVGPVRRSVAARRQSAIRTPAASRDQFFDLTAFTLPAPGTLGNAKKGSLKGPGTWMVNLAFYKDLFRSRGPRSSSRRSSTTRSTIRSSSCRRSARTASSI